MNEAASVFLTIVNISKRQFLQKHGEIQSNLVELTEKKNKTGKLILPGPWIISTCTLKLMKEKLSENNIGISFGTVLSQTVFYHFCNRNKLHCVFAKFV